MSLFLYVLGKKKKSNCYKFLIFMCICIGSMKNVTILVCHACKTLSLVEITCTARPEDFISLSEILLGKLHECFILRCL